MAKQSTDTPGFGYWPKRENGEVVERRRRPNTGTWSEIRREDEKRHSVRCQHGSEPGESEFVSIGRALPAAKDPASWCPQCTQAAELVSQAKAAPNAKREAKPKTEAKREAKPKRQRRSGKANGPRLSDGRRRPVKSRSDEALKTAA